MSRYHSYLSTASLIVQSYKGTEPFVHFIRKYFAAQKKFGSSDRRMIASLCYCFFRTAYVFKTDSIEQKIIKGVFLCETKNNLLLQELNPELNERIEWAMENKCHFLKCHLSAVFPFSGELSNEINKNDFTSSFLRQPLLFLRLRPGKKHNVIAKLTEASLPYKIPKQDCIALKNATSLDKVLRLNKEAVVQDFNSQRVFDFPANLNKYSTKEKKISVWDCCAASGGKSILLYDKLEGNIKLTVSDIRKNILHNLQQRLQEAQVPVYKTFATDLTQCIPEDKGDLFELIICDVPCTGSGTWSRTPEQLAFFEKKSIKEYAVKQKKIAGNATALLKKGGLLFYITCSVFKEENEAVVEILQKNYALNLLHMEYLTGYHMQADTLFVAVLKK